MGLNWLRRNEIEERKGSASGSERKTEKHRYGDVYMEDVIEAESNAADEDEND